MESICPRGDSGCEVHALSIALHALHIYCATLAAALITCCAHKIPGYGRGVMWRGQTVRGVSSVLLGVVSAGQAAAALLRPGARVQLVVALLAPVAWFVANWLHVALWNRQAAAPLLYLGVYWLLAATSSAAALWHQLHDNFCLELVGPYAQTLSLLLCVVVASVDFICFYDEVTKKCDRDKTTTLPETKVGYKHGEVHFYSKITFFWINSLLYRGFKTTLDYENFGVLPEYESSNVHYDKFKKIYYQDKIGLWRSYMKMIWPNFYLAGILKLFSDMMAVVPPLGLSVVVTFLEAPTHIINEDGPLTLKEYFNNGYVMLFLLTLALILQAIFSQNSTHLVTVEGIRLKTALQAVIYDKCMRLAPWDSRHRDIDEESPLIHSAKSENVKDGLITNLISQDTHNIMSCVWIWHYVWAIPVKISFILYLLYTKLGVSAIIGCAVSIGVITPVQFYLGRKISENSKETAKCTDKRISKMTEILQNMNVIKLYVWEELFKEKILNIREVELKLLNKDTIYMNCLTFNTQISTVTTTVITFSVYSVFNGEEGFTAANVFAGLALFNQLTVPLLILPITVHMIIQFIVSTKRIKDFLQLPESCRADDEDSSVFRNFKSRNSSLFNDAFIQHKPEDEQTLDNDKEDQTNNGETYSDDETQAMNDSFLLKFQNASFSWNNTDAPGLEIEDLEIPSGKLIMIVGSSGSGKSSFLSAVIGEMFLERGEVTRNERCVSYAGQPPWLMEASVRENILMDGLWCSRRYARVLRATGLRPDLQLLPEGDATRLGRAGAPLSGGQRVRLAVARALYSRSRLLVLDEPLAALDATLARHLMARALLPASRSGRTVLLSTNRIELMHYADLVIVMNEGRVEGCGPMGRAGVLAQWAQLASEARSTAARAHGPADGTARERQRLVRALSRAKSQRITPDTSLEVCDVSGAQFFAEVAMYGSGSWRSASMRQRPALSRQLSSPPSAGRSRRDIRRVMSVDASDITLKREASLMRRLLRPRPHRAMARWTPRPLRRLLSSDSEPVTEDNPNITNHGDEHADLSLSSKDTTITTNGVELHTPTNSNRFLDTQNNQNEQRWWWWYVRACGWPGAAAALLWAAAQVLALLGDCWLARATQARDSLSPDQTWRSLAVYAGAGVFGLAAGAAGAACGGAGGARARRALHEHALHAALHAPPLHANDVLLHTFAADVHVVDKKLPIAISRWLQLSLMCVAAAVYNAYAAPMCLLAILPALLIYTLIQNVYLWNARVLQDAEARAAAPLSGRAVEACGGGPTVRAGALHAALRDRLAAPLHDHHQALLLINAANRWLGLAMDVTGGLVACAALCGGGGALAGALALQLPAYLAHVAKGRADLDLQRAALLRLRAAADLAPEDYRDHCEVPPDWPKDGSIELQNVSFYHNGNSSPSVSDVSLSIAPGEKVVLCGRSGSGKSSLLAGVAGAARAVGRVRVCGADARRLPLRALRRRLVVLPQDAALFAGTLRENIDPLAVHSDAEIWQALRVVGLSDHVSAQPPGLECSVEWRGGRAARAMAARAAVCAGRGGVLLLDEPGAALDAAAERALLRALVRAAPDNTLVAVAHRVSCVRLFDRAVVLERGRVVEQGAPAALLAAPHSRLSRLSAAAHDR